MFKLQITDSLSSPIRNDFHVKHRVDTGWNESDVSCSQL